MKQHQIDLFIKAFNELDKSVSFLNNYYDSCTIVETNYDAENILNRLDHTVTDIEDFLLKQEMLLKEKNYETSFIEYTIKKIVSFLNTELSIVEINHQQLYPHLVSNVDPLILSSSKKTILRKLDALVYESENITMIPHGEFNSKPNNIVKMPIKKSRAHLTLVK